MLQTAAATIVLALAPVLPGWQGDQKPTPEEIQQAVEAVDAAFAKDGTPAQRVAAVTAAAAVPATKVVKALDKGLKDRDPGVVDATVVALGRMNHADALRSLHAFYKKNRKKLQDAEKTLALTFKAIALHGDESSVPILTDKLFSAPFHSVVQARIYGLGMIRSPKSVAGIFSLMSKTSRRSIEDYMKDLRLSLVALTGTDQGLSVNGWQEWWIENKKTLVVPPELKFDPAKDYFWNLRTSKGDIKIRLMPDVAPMHVSSTIYLVRLGFYDDLIFHRVITGFMAQGGCPSGSGGGSPGYKYAGETDPEVKHDRPGLLSMANAGPGTDGSQFFLTFVPTPHLDGKHTIFGEVVEGMKVVKALESQGSRGGAPREKLGMLQSTITVAAKKKKAGK